MALLIERLIGRLFGLWSRLNPDRRMVHISGALQQAERILLCLPRSPQQLHQAHQALPALLTRLRPAQVTLLAYQKGQASLETLVSPAQIYLLTSENIGRSGLPCRTLYRQICDQPYTVAIDMNGQFVLATAYLCRRSKAALRIGFQNPKSASLSAPFFNVRFSFSEQQAPSYQILIHFIETFTRSPAVN